MVEEAKHEGLYEWDTRKEAKKEQPPSYTSMSPMQRSNATNSSVLSQYGAHDCCGIANSVEMKEAESKSKIQTRKIEQYDLMLDDVICFIN